MRAQKVIPLGDSRSVILNELRVREARRILALSKELAGQDINELLTNRFDEIVLLLGDGIQMPPGESLEDLSGSELKDVIDGLLAVNASFLDLIGLVSQPPMETPSATSTEPASPSSSAAT